MQSKVKFIEDKIMKEFMKLSTGNDSERKIYKEIIKAVAMIEKDSHTGVQIPKKLIPKRYVKKYGLTNLWKYDLPEGWRLIYTIKSEGMIVFSLIIEWFDHKNYEKRFNYLV